MIIKPYITEKSLKNDQNRYTFLVELDSSKTQVKELIEKLYKVNVIKVAAIRSKATSSRSGRTGRRKTIKPYKKMIIQLNEKQTIPLFQTK